MSSGNTTTEYTRAEMASDDAVIRAAALTRNCVLRRALEIAAAEVAGEGADPNSLAALMVVWVMQASEEVDAAMTPPNRGLIAEMEGRVEG